FRSVEVRINAEDPEQDFAPTPGTLDTFIVPGGPGVRVDTGFVAGDTVSPFYDSLLAKVICWGVDRGPGSGSGPSGLGGTGARRGEQHQGPASTFVGRHTVLFRCGGHPLARTSPS